MLVTCTTCCGQDNANNNGRKVPSIYSHRVNLKITLLNRHCLVSDLLNRCSSTERLLRSLKIVVLFELYISSKSVATHSLSRAASILTN